MADTDVLQSDFARADASAFARVLASGTVEEINGILEQLAPASAAPVVARLPEPLIEALIGCNEPAVKSWLSETPLDTAIELLAQIPREISLSLVNSLDDRERRRRLLQYLHYPAHSVGALVQDQPPRFLSHVPAEEALAGLRGLDGEDACPAVVVEADATYLGLLDIWKLVTSTNITGSVRHYVDPASPLHAETPIASAISHPDWHDHNWLPVIDHERRILGGVSRARLFGALEHRSGERADKGVISSLITQIPYVTGQLANHTWSRWKSS